MNYADAYRSLLPFARDLCFIPYGLPWLSRKQETAMDSVLREEQVLRRDVGIQAVMEAVRDFLALPLRTVQEGNSFTKA